MSFYILGTGSRLPARAVTNDELSRSLDTSDEWITQRVGVRERRVCTTETTAELAYGAARNALEMSGVTPGELDMIICATITADSASPSLACSVQAMLGAACPAMDINAACSGFIYALDAAAGYFARKKAEKMLVIGAERLSKIVDWNDRGTAVIFGDGAGAVVLGAGDAYLSSKLYARGGEEVISIPNFSGASPYRETAAREPYIRMNGQETFKFAVNAICTDISEVIDGAGLSLGDISWVVPHQANARIISAAAKKLGLPPDIWAVNIGRAGNTSSASIPILLDELNRAGKLENGSYLALCGFGGGLTSAACVLRWGVY